MNDIETTQVIPVETMSEIVFGERLIKRSAHIRIERRKTVRKTVAMMLVSIGLLFGAVANAAPAKAQKADDMVKVAECRDGKTYYAPTNEHRGACSGHGGVASFADGTPVKSGGKSARYR